MNQHQAGWIDTHAHLYLPEFDEDRSHTIGRAREAGLTSVYMPNIDETTVEKMLATEEDSGGFCHSMIGLHPCSVNADYKRQLGKIESWLSKHNFQAIGEMGTDLHWDKTFWSEQQEVFAVQARWSAELQVPMVIHCRDSLDETIALLRKLQDGRLRGVFHCFTGTWEQVEAILSLGFMLGIGGVLTFKKSALPTAIARIDKGAVVLETDCPYLAPTPYRGKRNEPAFVIKVGEKLAETWGLPVEEIRKITHDNAVRLFRQA